MISIIVAMDDKRGIGKGNQMLWHISEDFKRFKAITTGHPIIMGRKTFDSIGRVLPNRTNIVITRDLSKTIPGCIMASSLEDALGKAKQSEGNDEIFIIGGGQIFSQALPLVDKLYLTLVKGDFSADTFFPEYETLFPQIISEETKQEGAYTYTYQNRKKN